ncbi:hypothetical protein SE17_01070 [Kouleothrix aurantiaca]|uniref:Uncharacterized protein n=1 Tax=Kouleothrix aurantiaca TaxID=186479 RepID=A0A0P9DH91_9CHLR|nr:hypothetical protein SE17_01070 [Kouleothrix aurantiaca]
MQPHEGLDLGLRLLVSELGSSELFFKSINLALRCFELVAEGIVIAECPDDLRVDWRATGFFALGHALV